MYAFVCACGAVHVFVEHKRPQGDGGYAGGSGNAGNGGYSYNSSYGYGVQQIAGSL